MPAVLGRVSLRSVRKARVKEVPLSEVKDALSRYLRQAEEQPVVITRHGKPAGILIGFESDDDWFDYRLENDPRLPGGMSSVAHQQQTLSRILFGISRTLGIIPARDALMKST